jgi:manganese oxidase
MDRLFGRGKLKTDNHEKLSMLRYILVFVALFTVGFFVGMAIAHIIVNAFAQVATDNPIPQPNMLRLPPSSSGGGANFTKTIVVSTVPHRPTQVTVIPITPSIPTHHFAASPPPTTASINPFVYDKIKGCARDQETPTNYVTYLTHFSCGHIHIASNGTVFRDFSLVFDDNHGVGFPIQMDAQDKNVTFHAWLINGSLPGPTLRYTVGDHISINVFDSKNSAFTHSFHMHNIHPADADGMMGPGSMIFPGANYTYRFVANPAGVYPYHCHMTPTEEHINRGLFGTMIIDPATPRQQAVEMVMTLNGFSYDWQDYKTGTPHVRVSFPCSAKMLETNFTGCLDESSDGSQPDNQFYSVNGMAFGYDIPHPIVLHAHVPYRIYLTNMLEFEPVNSFHIHAQMFYFYPAGTFPSAPVYTDTLILGQGQRGIVQLEFPYPGLYFFHSHINHQSDLGWQGFFLVQP